VLEPGFQPGRTEQPTTRGNGSPTRATANHESFDTLEGSKPSWMVVALIELPFPLVVGYSMRPGRKPGLTRPPRLQGFVPPMRIGNFWYTGDAPLVVCPLLGFPWISMVFSRHLQHPLPGADSCGLAQGLPEDTIVADL
jgi:hypothetical protein